VQQIIGSLDQTYILNRIKTELREKLTFNTGSQEAGSGSAM
jgi:hypothetical protein